MKFWNTAIGVGVISVLLFLCLFSLVNAAPTVCAISTGCTGTGTPPTYGKILIGNALGQYDYVASSTLGGTGTGFATTSADYWITTKSTSDVSEGSNLYWTQIRFDTALTATTSLPHITTLAGLLLPYSQLTSTPDLSFSTTSASYFLSQNRGAAFSTTSADYWGGTKGYLTSISGTYPVLTSGSNISLAFGTTTANNWSALQNFNANATATALTISDNAWLSALTNSLLATDQNGKVVATTSISTGLLTGVLPIANGGTNRSSITDPNRALYYTGSSINSANTTQAIFTPYASTTALSATILCFTGDTCRATWPSGGTGNVSTSSVPAIGGVAYWTTTTATPALLGTIASSSITFSGPFAGYSSLGALIGGSNSTVTWTGLATTSQPASSNLLVSNGAAGVYGVATSTLTPSSPLTGSFTQIGSGGSVGIQAASASQAGSLAAADYQLLHTATTTFSSPLVYTQATNAVTCPTCQTSAAAWPWTSSTFYGTSTNATTTVTHYTMGLQASSTSYFTNASTTLSTVLSNTWFPYLTNSLLSTDQNGKLVATSTIGNSLLTNSGALTVNTTAPLSGGGSVALGGTLTLTCSNCNTYGWPWSISTTYGTSTNATTTPSWFQTGLFASPTSQLFYASTTQLSAASLCLTGDTCRTTWPTATAAAWAFTPSTYGGVANQSTTTPLWLNGTQLIASSTLVVNATTTGSHYFPGSGVWNASGNVGIGTTSPTDLLSLNGASPKISFQDSTNGRGFYVGVNDGFNGVLDASGGNVLLKTGGTTRAQFSSGVSYVANSTAFGIGTTTPTKSLAIQTGGASAGQITFDSGGATNRIMAHTSSDISVTTLVGNAANLTLQTNSSGSVGIATTTPDWPLTISNGAATHIKLTGTNGANPWGFSTQSDGRFLISQPGTGERLSITSTGLVGIASSTPTGSKLTIEGTGLMAKYANLTTTNYTQTQWQGTGRAWNVGVGNGAETVFGVPNKFFVYDDNANAMRMVIDTSGNVGIGTTTPQTAFHIATAQAKLRINTSVADSGFYGIVDGSGNQSFSLTRNSVVTGLSDLYIQATHGIGFGVNSGTVNVSNNKMYLDTSGNLGIGTTSPQWALTAANATKPQLALTDASASSNAWTFRNITGSLYFATSSFSATSTTAALTITPNGHSIFGGNLGIGTSSPAATLGVAGASFFTGDLTIYKDNPSVNIRGNTTNGARLGVINTAGDWYFGVGSSGDFFFNTNTTLSTDPQLTILNTNGNVGIGTSTPYALLSVATPLGATGSVANLFEVASSSPTGTSTLFVVKATGNIGVGTTSPGTLLSLQGVANFNTATSTFYSTGGINLIGGGCFAVNGACVSGGVVGSSASTTLLSDNNTWSNKNTFSALTALASTTITGNTTLTATTFTALSLTGAQSTPNSQTYFGINSAPTFTDVTSGTLGTFYGIQSNPRNTSTSSTVTTMRAVYGLPQNSGGGAVGTMTGVYAAPTNSSGTTTTMYGYYSNPTHSALSTTTSMYGLFSTPELNGAGGITNLYGAYIDPVARAASSGLINDMYGVMIRGGSNSTAFATTTNYYQLYLDTPLVVGSITNPVFGLYQEYAQALNFFAGKVGIGTTTPITDFQVATSTANATTSIHFGKAGQNKGTCIKLYTSNGTAAYLMATGTPTAAGTPMYLTSVPCATITGF